MEPWQSEHIKKNLQNLIQWTDLNCEVKAVLQANDILFDVDIEFLDAQRNSNGRIHASSKFYDLLKTRTNAYEIMTKALIDSCQSGAAKILLDGMLENGIHEPYTYLGIPLNEFQFGHNEIKINEKNFTIEDFFSGNNINEVQKIFKKCLPEVEYYEIFVKRQKKFSLARDTIPTKPSYYIERYLSNKIILDKRIFQENCSDIFIFKNLQRYELSEMVRPNRTSLSQSQVEILSSRFIHLDREDDWNEIIKIATVPVHLVNYDVKFAVFVLENTSGHSDILKKYGLKRNRVYITEEEFVQQQNGSETRGVCICDTPGMGKTLLLTNIAHSLAAKYPKSIVAFIPLNKFFENIDYPNSSPDSIEKQDTDNVFRQFSSPPENSDLLLNLAMGSLIKLELLFDGFDEIPLDNIEWTKQWLQIFMKKFPTIRIYITSRPHMKTELEDTLGVIAYDMLPFNKRNQIDFLVNFWTAKNHTTKNELIEKCAVECLKAVEGTLTSDDTEITGIPLQCQLIAEVYGNEARQFCLSGGKTFRFSSLQTCNMYKNYVEQRISLATENQTQLDCFQRLHMWHAIQLLFPQNDLSIDVTHFDNENEIILKAGILKLDYSRDIQKLEFVHRTFAEYLVAQYFVDLFFLELQVKEESSIKFFLNVILEFKEEPYNDGYFNFVHDVIAYFLDSLLTNLAASQYIIQEFSTHLNALQPENVYRVLCASSCQQNLVQIFRFIVKALILMGNDKILQVFTKHGIYRLVYNIILKNKHHNILFDCMQLITQTLDYKITDVCDFPDERSWLDIAFVCGNYEGFDFLFDKCAFSSKDLIRRCILNTMAFEDPYVTAAKVNILKVILNRRPSTVNEVNRILFAEALDVMYIKVLIEFGADTMLDEDGENFVCCNIGGLCVYDCYQFHELVKFLVLDRKAEYLFKASSNWHDPLPCIIKVVSLLPETFDIILNIPGVDINKETNGENLLFSAIRGNKLNNVQELVKRGVDPKKRGVDNKTRSGPEKARSGQQILLHECYQIKNRFDDSISEYLLSLGMDANAQDIFGNTPLHEVWKLSQAKLLLRHGSNINTKNIKKQSVLLKTVSHADTDLIRYLVSKGLDIEDRDLDGFTALLLCGNEDSHRCCVELGADATAKNQIGQGALHRAVVDYYQIDTYIRYLVSTGLNINETDHVGNAPLHYCIRYDTVKCLVGLGANIHVKNKAGQRVLHTVAASTARRDYKEEIFQYLASFGLNINDHDHFGKTPLFYCQEGDIERLARLGAKY